MNWWDEHMLESGQGDGDLEGIGEVYTDPKKVRLNYLKFLRDVVFGGNRQLEVVKCRRFPEFGTIQRDQIDHFIRMVERGQDFYILDGPDSLQPRKIEAGKWSNDTLGPYTEADAAMSLAMYNNPDELVGKQVTVSLKPIGSHYSALLQIKKDLFDAAEILHDPQVAYVEVDTIGKVTRDNIEAYCIAYGVKGYNCIYPKYETRVNREGKTYTYKEDDMNSSLDPDFLRREANRMLARAEVLDAMPQTDTFGDGQVLTFERTFGSETTYYYATIKSGAYWFVTGDRAPNKIQWVALVEFMGTTGMQSLRVVDRSKAVPIAEYVKGVQQILEANA